MTPAIRIEWIDESSPLQEHVRRMLFDVMYRDFGVPLSGPWRDEAPGYHAVALMGERVLGSVRLVIGEDPGAMQLRQLAVEPAVRNEGIGRALVEAAELKAAHEGARVVWLNARNTAYPFYERLGYEYDGEPFESELTRIEHRRMWKRVSDAPS